MPYELLTNVSRVSNEHWRCQTFWRANPVAYRGGGGVTRPGRHFERERHSAKGGGEKVKFTKLTLNDAHKVKFTLND